VIEMSFFFQIMNLNQNSCLNILSIEFLIYLDILVFVYFFKTKFPGKRIDGQYSKPRYDETIWTLHSLLNLALYQFWSNSKVSRYTPNSWNNSKTENFPTSKLMVKNFPSNKMIVQLLFMTIYSKTNRYKQ
jgi:hypothetical protein